MNPLPALLVPATVLLAATTLSGPVPDGERAGGTARPGLVVDRAATTRTGTAPPAARTAPPAASTTGLGLQRRAAPVATPPSELALRGRWRWPLEPRPAVMRPFVAPATRYGAGHRGVDLAGTPGQPVLAVAAGTVAHVGTIAGRGTVTVLHPSGIRSTYEPVTPAVRPGQQVTGGAVVGRLATAGSHCTPASCLHLGAIRGDAYLDPLMFLTARRVRLLPMQ